jgi:hypothetical protein
MRIYKTSSPNKIALQVVANEYSLVVETVKTYFKRVKRQYKGIPPKKPR